MIWPNGSTTVLYRDFLPHQDFPATNVIGSAHSSTTWRGPYSAVHQIFPDYAEDPHIYRDHRGNLHMVAHSLCMQWPNCTAVGGHAASEDDGMTWHYTGAAAYTTTVHFEDGSIKDF